MSGPPRPVLPTPPIPDGRPLHARVEALARRFAAQASGHRKNAHSSLQLAQNALDDADVLFEAAKALEGR